jgi:hypothetical protein
LRQTPTSGIAIPSTNMQSFSCTAMYADMVIANTTNELTVPVPEEKEASSQ